MADGAASRIFGPPYQHYVTISHQTGSLTGGESVGTGDLYMLFPERPDDLGGPIDLYSTNVRSGNRVYEDLASWRLIGPGESITLGPYEANQEYYILLEAGGTGSPEFRSPLRRVWYLRDAHVDCTPNADHTNWEWDIFWETDHSFSSSNDFNDYTSHVEFEIVGPTTCFRQPQLPVEDLSTTIRVYEPSDVELITQRDLTPVVPRVTCCTRNATAKAWNFDGVDPVFSDAWVPGIETIGENIVVLFGGDYLGVPVSDPDAVDTYDNGTPGDPFEPEEQYVWEEDPGIWYKWQRGAFAVAARVDKDCLVEEWGEPVMISNSLGTDYDTYDLSVIPGTNRILANHFINFSGALSNYVHLLEVDEDTLDIRVVDRIDVGSAGNTNGPHLSFSDHGIVGMSEQAAVTCWFEYGPPDFIARLRMAPVWISGDFLSSGSPVTLSTSAGISVGDIFGATTCDDLVRLSETKGTFFYTDETIGEWEGHGVVFRVDPTSSSFSVSSPDVFIRHIPDQFGTDPTYVTDGYQLNRSLGMGENHVVIVPGSNPGNSRAGLIQLIRVEDDDTFTIVDTTIYGHWGQAAPVKLSDSKIMWMQIAFNSTGFGTIAYTAEIDLANEAIGKVCHMGYTNEEDGDIFYNFGQKGRALGQNRGAFFGANLAILSACASYPVVVPESRVQSSFSADGSSHQSIYGRVVRWEPNPAPEGPLANSVTATSVNVRLRSRNRTFSG